MQTARVLKVDKAMMRWQRTIEVWVDGGITRWCDDDKKLNFYNSVIAFI